MQANILKAISVCRIDIALSIVVILGFQIIVQSFSEREEVPLYFDFLSTAKWVLIAGFVVHGLTNLLSQK